MLLVSQRWLLFPADVVGVALLRYRLIGVDLWLRRSIVFGGALSVIALAYLGAVGLLGLADGEWPGTAMGTPVVVDRRGCWPRRGTGSCRRRSAVRDARHAGFRPINPAVFRAANRRPAGFRPDSIRHTFASMTDMTPSVETTGPTKRLGKNTAVDGLDLAVKRGEVVAALDPNGAGKTTFSQVVATLIRPDQVRCVSLGTTRGAAVVGRTGRGVRAVATWR